VRQIAPRLRAACGLFKQRLWPPRTAVATIGQCINGGHGWLEVECKLKTRASLPLDAIRRASGHADLEA
jgi:hypothetical protein